MALYFKPPRGDIESHVLQKCVDARLEFFKAPDMPISVYNMDYLHEDSALDRAGHFTLRLAAVQDSSFAMDFANHEVKLLKMRLESYDGDLMRNFLKKQVRHARECVNEVSSERVVELLTDFIAVALKMLSRSCMSHAFAGAEFVQNECRGAILSVPFQFCPFLIETYEVELRKGCAQVPCFKWKDLFLSFYKAFLKNVIKEMHFSKNVFEALKDWRIKSIIGSICSRSSTEKNSVMPLSEIQSYSKHFPLCMLHLQNVLRKKHRLSHEERFDFSLFLKDIGLSLEDSILYWKFEYSQKQSACAQCSHSWEKDEKKYVYSIRHLYGLEGSRKTYTTRPCHYFQNMLLRPMQEGGCPFKYFDEKKLESLLKQNLDGSGSNDVRRILSTRETSATSACKMYLKCSNGNADKSSLNGDSSFKNPAQYFNLLKNK